MNDLFERIEKSEGTLKKWADYSEGYYMFPKLEGELSNRMTFNGKEVICWSLNNYLGIGNLPEVREADTQATKDWGLAYPMGARMMSGHTEYHEKLESELAKFLSKESCYLLNFGYQGMVSIIDSLISKEDVIVFDVDSHACIYDGVRMHHGQRFVYRHNDMASLEKNLTRATKIADKTGGGILVISEGVFGMRGEQGKLKEIVDLKKKFNFRLLVDDAHGFGTLGKTGAGAGEEQGVQDEIDVYFGTFAKSMALIGAFVASKKEIVKHLKYSMRSQIFAKSLPMPMVIGALKRLELIRNNPQFKEKLWDNVRKLQDGLRNNGFDLGTTNSCVTPVYLNGTVIEATTIVKDLRENYMVFCSAVIYPVIPMGMIILRLIPTSLHTDDDIEKTLFAFNEIRKKLESKEYAKNSPV